MALPLLHPTAKPLCARALSGWDAFESTSASRARRIESAAPSLCPCSQPRH